MAEKEGKVHTEQRKIVGVKDFDAVFPHDANPINRYRYRF